MFALLCISLSIVPVGTVTAAPADLLTYLLPRPQQAACSDGTFALRWDDLGFVLRTPSEKEDANLGARLDEMQTRAGFKHALHISECPAAGYALLMFSGDVMPGVEKSELPPEAAAEGYVLNVTDKGVVITAVSERGLFYGMMTLEQLLDAARTLRVGALPCVRIVDWPAIAMRGYHEDYGRDQLPTVEDHKRTIRLLAQYKMNTHLWFIESNHFKYAFDPDLGSEYDRFTFDELREVVAYAHQYYIEVIPVVELLAHMEFTLNNPKYAPLAEVEGSGVLCPTSDESFDLVRKMVNEIAPAFDGRYFHCALDESAAVGQGKSAEAVKAKGIEQVYADYYTRMNDLIKSHGKTMMMYGDIVLNHPGILKLLPKDIVMMYWDYGDAAHHPGFDTLAQSGLTTVSLSALWDWANLYPMYAFAFKNIENLARQTAELKSPGHFTANWGDWNLGSAGANLSELNYYGVVYSGAESWKPEPIPFPEFSAAFAAQFFGIGARDCAEAFTLLALAQGEGIAWNQRARKMFHAVPAEQVAAMAKARDEELAFWKNLKERAGKAHVLLKKSRTGRNADYLQSYDLAARMLEFAADMALECRATAEALKAPDFKAKKYADAFDALNARQQILRDEYYDVYAATNKPINLRYIATSYDKSKKDLSDFAAALRKGEKPAVE